MSLSGLLSYVAGAGAGARVRAAAVEEKSKKRVESLSPDYATCAVSSRQEANPAVGSPTRDSIMVVSKRSSVESNVGMISEAATAAVCANEEAEHGADAWWEENMMIDPDWSTDEPVPLAVQRSLEDSNKMSSTTVIADDNSTSLRVLNTSRWSGELEFLMSPSQAPPSPEELLDGLIREVIVAALFTDESSEAKASDKKSGNSPEMLQSLEKDCNNKASFADEPNVENSSEDGFTLVKGTLDDCGTSREEAIKESRTSGGSIAVIKSEKVEGGQQIDTDLDFCELDPEAPELVEQMGPAPVKSDHAAMGSSGEETLKREHNQALPFIFYDNYFGLVGS